VNRFQRSTANSHAAGVSPPSSSDTTVASRTILATLQPNLRRLPSRQYLSMKSGTRDVSQNLDVPVGSKRKRVASVNENTHAGGRLARGAPKLKRLKVMSARDSSSEEEELSDMDVDVPGRWTVSDASEIDCDEEECECHTFLYSDALILTSISRRVSHQ
jgi:mitogen-activated protein kinase kinase kinase 13